MLIYVVLKTTCETNKNAESDLKKWMMLYFLKEIRIKIKKWRIYYEL